MKYKLFFGVLVLTFLSISCQSDKKPNFTIVDKFSNIENLFTKSNDTVFVINFWATTCPPCIKELALFDEALLKHENDPFQTYLISIDDDDRVEKYVKPFIKKLNIKSPIYSLIDDDMTSWTAKVNPKWYGSLPYTVIYKGDKKKYFFGAFKDHNDLEKEIQSFLIN